MESGFNYNILLNQALDKIRNIRDPRSLHQEYVLYGLKESQSNSAVSIGGEAFTTYSDIVESAQAVTIQCLEMTIFYLLQHYGYDVERVDASKINNDANFAILDKAKSTLLLFKKPFNDLVIAGPNCVTDDEDKAKECFMARHHDDLLKSMNEEQKDILERFDDCWSEYASLAE